MLFGKLTDRDRADMARIIRNLMTDDFVNARDNGIEFTGIVDLAEGFEGDIKEAFEEWLEHEEYEFEVSDCDEFMDRNARWCLELSGMAKKLKLDYAFDALDPHTFVGDVYAMMAYELMVYLYDSSDIVPVIVRNGFQMDFKEEYILSAEAEKWITPDAIDEVMERLEQRCFNNAEC